MRLTESAALDVPSLIWILPPHHTPPLVLKAPQNCASSLAILSVSPEPPAPRSRREWYQTAPRLPVVGSSEILGRNWLFTVESSLTRTPRLQVTPPSSE